MSTNNGHKTMVEHALDALQIGAVFPCNGKIPAISKERGGHGCLDATTIQIRVKDFWKEYPDANPAISTDGKIVLDFDTKENAFPANKSAWKAKYGPLPRTRVHRTGGGGEHWIYQAPAGLQISGGDNCYGIPHVDIRSWHQYIMAPGSIHPDSGKRYGIIDDSPVAAAFPALVEVLKSGAKSKKAAQLGNTSDNRIPPGGQDDWLISQAGLNRSRGDDRPAIRAKIVLDIQRLDQDPQKPPYTDKDIDRIADSAMRWPPGQPYPNGRTPDPSALPEIILTGKHLREQTTEALQALYKSNNPPHIFRRGGALTRIGLDEKGIPYTETLTESALRGKLARSANFVRIDERGVSRPIAPPLDVTRDIDSLGAWDFPALESITESPALRLDGTVLTMPGYDVITRLYYAPAPGLKVPTIPDTPTESELKVAIGLVLEILCDFPFDSGASRANAIGALLTPVLRPAVNGIAPLPIIDKPQAGTGASLIADVISIIATGHFAATMGLPQSEEEWEKKLSSHLLAGRSLCVIDNIEGKLYSDTLSRYLTSTHVSIRPLGRSADIILANNMSFIATGNNVRLGGDMPRRCYWIRLDAGLARPWLREVTFRHPNLREWVFAIRGSILAAQLTIARGWITAGRPVPEGLPTLGGFESYCRTVGGVLAFMGVTGFMDNLMSMYDKMDADTPQWEGFLEQWRETIGETPVTVSELIKKLNENDDLSATLPDAIATRDARDYSRRLGNTLAKRAGVQLPNGLTVIRAGTTRTRAVAWSVQSYQNANSTLFSLNAELAELKNTPCAKQPKDTLYSNGAGINSHNSASGTKPAELTQQQYSCGVCGGHKTWRGQWGPVCSICHPNPNEVST